MAENREAQPHVIMMPMSTGRNRGAWVQSQSRSFVRRDGGRVAKNRGRGRGECRESRRHFSVVYAGNVTQGLYIVYMEAT